MDVASLRRTVEAKMVNDRVRQQIKKKIQDYKDQQQDFGIRQEKVFKPITKVQEETKSLIDEKQDKIIKELKGNQTAIMNAIEEMYEDAPEEQPQPQPQPQPREQKAIEQARKEEMVKTLKFDAEKELQDGDVALLAVYKFKRPNDVINSLVKGETTRENIKKEIDKINTSNKKAGPITKNIEEYLRRTRKNQDVSSYKETMKIVEGMNVNQIKEMVRERKRQVETLQRYNNAMRKIYSATELIGSGIRKYKQPKRHAYKVGSNGQYGGLLINVPRLLNNMVIEATMGGNIVYENKADKSLIELLTKRFNPKKKYSSQAKRVFNDLNLLSAIPRHRSSGKTNLIGGAVYFTSPEDMMKRLTLITGSRSAGNTSIALRNEVWEIIDKLLQDKHITKQQYDAYINKHLA